VEAKPYGGYPQFYDVKITQLIEQVTGGEPMETRCMAACVGKIRMQSLVRIGEDGLWAEDRWHPLYYAIRVEQVALPLYPQWGTEPNGFYIPPRLCAPDVRPRGR